LSSFSLIIAQFCVTFAQFLRYLHIPALIDIHGDHLAEDLTAKKKIETCILLRAADVLTNTEAG
jgi:hypothetical protein